jgi:hypothetical protein
MKTYKGKLVCQNCNTKYAFNIFVPEEQPRANLNNNLRGRPAKRARGRPRGGTPQGRLGIKKEAQPQNMSPKKRPAMGSRAPVMEGSAKEEKDDQEGKI